MKQNSIWIDYSNSEQIDWWNNTASKLVRVVRYDQIVETATGKPVGVLFMIEGLFKNYIIRENVKRFVDNSATVSLKTPR